MLLLPEEYRQLPESVLVEMAERELDNLKRDRIALAKANQEEHKTVEGLGQLVARISMREYMLVRILYEKHPMQGDNIWHDQEFVAAYLRDNPEIRVNTTRGTKGQEITK